MTRPVVLKVSSTTFPNQWELKPFREKIVGPERFRGHLGGLVVGGYYKGINNIYFKINCFCYLRFNNHLLFKFCSLFHLICILNNQFFFINFMFQLCSHLKMLRVFENRILRQIFGPKRDANGKQIRLYNEEFHSLYVRVITF